MSNHTTRRQFLNRLLLAAGATPLAAHALTQPPAQLDTPHKLKPGWTMEPRQDIDLTVRGVAVKVPSNRIWFEDRESIYRDGYWPGRNAYHVYHRDWDGTFNMERDCTNPAYILADLYERTGA